MKLPCPSCFAPSQRITSRSAPRIIDPVLTLGLLLARSVVSFILTITSAVATEARSKPDTRTLEVALMTPPPWGAPGCAPTRARVARRPRPARSLEDDGAH